MKTEATVATIFEASAVERPITDELQRKEAEILERANIYRPLYEAVELSRSNSSEVLDYLRAEYEQAKAVKNESLAQNIATLVHEIALKQDLGISQITDVFQRAEIIMPILLDAGQKNNLENYCSWLYHAFNTHASEAKRKQSGDLFLTSSLFIAEQAQRAELSAYRELFLSLAEKCVETANTIMSLEQIAKSCCALGKYDFLLGIAEKTFKQSSTTAVLDVVDAFIEVQEIPYVVRLLEFLQREATENNFLRTALDTVLIRLVTVGYPVRQKNDVVHTLFEQHTKNGWFFLERCIESFIEEGNIVGAKEFIASENNPPQLLDALLQILLEKGFIAEVEAEIEERGGKYTELHTHQLVAIGEAVSPALFLEKLAKYKTEPYIRESALMGVFEKAAVKLTTFYTSPYSQTKYQKKECNEAEHYLEEYIPLLLEDATISKSPEALSTMVEYLSLTPHSELLQSVVAKLNTVVSAARCTTENACDRFIPMLESLSKYGYMIDVVGLCAQLQTLSFPPEKAITHYAAVLKIATNQHTTAISAEITQTIDVLFTSSLPNTTKQKLYKAFAYSGVLVPEKYALEPEAQTNLDLAIELLSVGRQQDALRVFTQLDKISEKNSFIRYVFSVGSAEFFSTVLPLIESQSLLSAFVEESFIDQKPELAFMIANYLTETDYIEQVIEHLSGYAEQKNRAVELEFLRFAEKTNARYINIALLVAKAGDIEFLISLLDNTTGVVKVDWVAETSADALGNFIEVLNLLVNHGKITEAKHYYALYVAPYSQYDQWKINFQKSLARAAAVQKIHTTLTDTTSVANTLLSNEECQDLHFSYLEQDAKPTEQLLRALVTLGINDFWFERFISLEPKETRGLLEERVSQFSRDNILSCYQEVLLSAEFAVVTEVSCDFERIARDWSRSGPNRGELFLKNCNALISLEQKRPGIITVLSSSQTFCLSSFARYPAEVLIDMFDAIGTTVKPGLVLVAKADWNGASYEDVDMYKKLHTQLKAKGYQLVVSEAGTRMGAAKRIIATHRLYQQQLLSFLIVVAHGTKRSFSLGERFTDTITMDDFLVTKDGAKPTILDRLQKNYYMPKMPWLFDSCSTGVPGGIAEASSAALGGVATAPDRPTALKNVTAVFDANDTLVGFEAEYALGVQWAETMTYSGGSRALNFAQILESALVG